MINKITRVISALVASVALTSPAVARVESGTPDLIRLTEEYGGSFVYNPSGCGGPYLGYYRPGTNEIGLCYLGTPNANDHNTVRHEVWHFIQHCAAKRRGLQGLTPVSMDSMRRTQWVSQYLRPAAISNIRKAYPARAHAIELEAFAAAESYTSDQIGGVLRKWCVRPT